MGLGKRGDGPGPRVDLGLRDSYEQNEKGSGGGMDGGSEGWEGERKRMEGCEGGEGVWGLRPKGEGGRGMEDDEGERREVELEVDERG